MTNSYLYGEDVEVEDIPEELIVRRIELLRDNLAELMEVPYLGRDEVRVNAIIKAVSFWQSINTKEK